MWEITWNNLVTDLASIPTTDTAPNSGATNKADEEIYISPEEEAAELRKDLGI